MRFLADLKDANDHVARLAFGDGRKDATRKPSELWITGLKAGCRRKVDQGWIDLFPRVQRPQDFRRPGPHALIVHVDQCAALGAQGVASVELGGTVGPQDLPIGAACQDFAAQIGAFETTAENLNDAAMPDLGDP